MTDVDLSICIPTYNRLSYLTAVIEALGPLRARLRTEIVVSDDASTDGTPAFLDRLAAGDPTVRVIHQPRRLGGFANTAYVLRAARGRYAVYHGDDDRLNADLLLPVVTWLDANPGHAAVYGPVDSYDLATGVSVGKGLHSSEIVEFDDDARVQLIEYVAMGLTPEHAVYRAEALRRTVHDPRIYWSLGFLDAALRLGRVRFAPDAFYRAVQRHWVGETRPQLGNELLANIVTFETFRAGLEMIAGGQRQLTARPDACARVSAAIDRTVRLRQSAALDFLMAQRQWPAFVHTYRVLALRRALPRAFPAEQLAEIALRAAAAALVERCAVGRHGGIALVGLQAIAAMLDGLLREAGVGDVRHLAEAAAARPAVGAGDDLLYLCEGPGSALALRAAGAPASAIVELDGVLRAWRLD